MKTFHSKFGECELMKQNLSVEKRRFQGLDEYQRLTESGNVVYDAACADGITRVLLAN